MSDVFDVFVSLRLPIAFPSCTMFPFHPCSIMISFSYHAELHQNQNTCTHRVCIRCLDFAHKAEVSKEEFLKDFFKTFKASKRFQSSKRSRTSQVSHKVLCREIQRCFTERGTCRSSNQVIPGLASSHVPG